MVGRHQMGLGTESRLFGRATSASHLTSPLFALFFETKSLNDPRTHHSARLAVQQAIRIMHQSLSPLSHLLKLKGSFYTSLPVFVRLCLFNCRSNQDQPLLFEENYSFPHWLGMILLVKINPICTLNSILLNICLYFTCLSYDSTLLFWLLQLCSKFYQEIGVHKLWISFFNIALAYWSAIQFHGNLRIHLWIWVPSV